MNFEQNVLRNTKYLGKFVMNGDEFCFKLDEGLRRKDLIAMGDIVYFMFVNNQLMKIGKAGGKMGFAGRLNTYQQGRGKYGDATNRRIMDVLDSIEEDTVEVYCVRCPRHVVEYNCPLTGHKIKEEISTHKETETRLTHKYLAESSSNELPFCNQLN